MVTDSTSVDYDVRGNGGAPALLMVNGLGFGRWGFFKQTPALSRHFRVITFDVRGEGNSAHNGDFVAELSTAAVSLLDHLKIGKAHVLGTSLGGFAAQRLALDRPDMVDRLVLVCTSYGGRGREQVSPQALGAMFGVGSLTAEGAARWGLEVATSEAYRSQKPGEFEQIARWRVADSPSLSAYYRQAMAGARFDTSRDVGDIYAPALVIHGREDRFIPVANAAALAEALPEATLRVLDDAGHLVFIEQASRVNRLIANFLEPRELKTGGGKTRRAEVTGKPEGRRARLAARLSYAVRSLTRKLLGGLPR